MSKRVKDTSSGGVLSHIVGSPVLWAMLPILVYAIDAFLTVFWHKPFPLSWWLVAFGASGLGVVASTHKIPKASMILSVIVVTIAIIFGFSLSRIATQTFSLSIAMASVLFIGWFGFLAITNPKKSVRAIPRKKADVLDDDFEGADEQEDVVEDVVEETEKKTKQVKKQKKQRKPRKERKARKGRKGKKELTSIPEMKSEVPAIEEFPVIDEFADFDDEFIAVDEFKPVFQPSPQLAAKEKPAQAKPVQAKPAPRHSVAGENIDEFFEAFDKATGSFPRVGLVPQTLEQPVGKKPIQRVSAKPKSPLIRGEKKPVKTAVDFKDEPSVFDDFMPFDDRQEAPKFEPANEPVMDFDSAQKPTVKSPLKRNGEFVQGKPHVSRQDPQQPKQLTPEKYARMRAARAQKAKARRAMR